MRFNFPMRLIVIAFSILYVVQSKLLRLLLVLAGPLDKLNLVIQMKKKLQQYNKARIYFQMLTELVPNLQDGKPYTASYVDFHLYKLALYIKFCSQVTQLVVDITLGLLFLLFIYKFPDTFFELSNYVGSNLHLEDIQ